MRRQWDQVGLLEFNARLDGIRVDEGVFITLGVEMVSLCLVAQKEASKKLCQMECQPNGQRGMVGCLVGNVGPLASAQLKRILFGMVLNTVIGVSVRIPRFYCADKVFSPRTLANGRYVKDGHELGVGSKVVGCNPEPMVVHGEVFVWHNGLPLIGVELAGTVGQFEWQGHVFHIDGAENRRVVGSQHEEEFKAQTGPPDGKESSPCVGFVGQFPQPLGRWW